MSSLVSIVIPVYKNQLNNLELRSIKRSVEAFGQYNITIIKPISLDIENITEQLGDNIEVESFEDHFFENIQGYNTLMLSSDLYRRFIRFEYIVICQLDVFVFYDCLADFMDKQYDYVGAPWLIRPLYEVPMISHYLKLKKKYHGLRGQACRQNLYKKVGNGGFSLRKVEPFLKASLEYKKRIDFYLSKKGQPLYNEDVFWSIEVPELEKPTCQQALKFAFDKYPKLCYRLNGNQLPMACHGWYKWKWRGFWKHYIDFGVEEKY